MLNEAAAPTGQRLTSAVIGGILAAYDNTTTSKTIRDLAIRGRAERTQQLQPVRLELARYYHRRQNSFPTRRLRTGFITSIERELSASSVNIAVNAVRFSTAGSLGRNTDQLMASVPRMKHAIRRPKSRA
jgi:hypothetical protein